MNIPSAELQLLHRAIASTENGISIVDMRLPDQPLVFVNPAFLRLTGYVSEEILGRNCRVLQGREGTGQLAIQALRDALARQEEITVLLNNFRKTGEAFCNELTVSPVFDGEGALTHYVGIQHDVSGREAAAIEIRLLNTRLAEIAVELKEKNKALETFSYSVSHDLKGPLSTIQGFAGILSRDPAIAASDRARQYLARIDSGTQQMNALIEALLALAQVSAGELKLVSCDLSAMATGLLASYAERDTPRAVKVRIQPGLSIIADRHLLERALDNLLSNAWKFTRKTPGALIEVDASQDEAGTLVLQVRDNGAGFDMACADKLFETFGRLHSSSDYEGTGIGLALVQRVVQRHGGSVWATSVPDQGSTFYFTVPAGGVA